MDLGLGLGKKMVREVRTDEPRSAEDDHRAEIAQLTIPVRLPRIWFRRTAVVCEFFLDHLEEKLPSYLHAFG